MLRLLYAVKSTSVQILFYFWQQMIQNHKHQTCKITFLGQSCQTSVSVDVVEILF